MVAILDQHGKPWVDQEKNRLRAELASVRREMATIRGRYDSAQTNNGNALHWAQADNFDPNTAARSDVRRTLRMRSRYECGENNPLLKGILQSVANDFVGSGPSLQITDPRIPDDRKVVIEQRAAEWAREIKLRQTLWRMKLAKMIDGEGIARAYRRRMDYPVQLDFQVVESEQCTSNSVSTGKTPDGVNEIDGVRYDNFGNPLEYHILDHHPGRGLFSGLGTPIEISGHWHKARHVLHWFRQDRGWQRGIPELAASLDMCADLRRYIKALVRCMEIAASFSVLIESESPANAAAAWTGEKGEDYEGSPFDVFHIEAGMINQMPGGYKASQLNSVPMGEECEAFVGLLVRMIVRPIQVTYNRAIGSSKDSNMASSVVDDQIYKSGHQHERTHCEDYALSQAFGLWWEQAVRIPGYLGDDQLASDRAFRRLPRHKYLWPNVGVQHTDPAKIAKSLETLLKNRFATQRHIQEEFYGRSVEDWEADCINDLRIEKRIADERKKLGLDESAEDHAEDQKPDKKKEAERDEEAK